MYLLPIGSNAPVYCFPWGTIALISLNTLILLLIGVGILPPLETLAPNYALIHGEGLHPVQWVTSNFLHDGLGHLFGNMLFLWPFGLIVEGKIGWQRFLLVYLGLGIAECLIEQLCLPGPGLSLGASSIVFGLMAISFVWAPRNDVELVWGTGLPPLFRSGTFEISVLWLSLLMVAKEVLVAVVLDFPVGSELFHIVGAALGFGVGASMLKGGLVDCEGWDLWTVLKAGKGAKAVLLHSDAAILDGRSAELNALTPEEEQTKKTRRKMRALGRIMGLLDEKRPPAALAELRKTQQVLSDFQLGQRDLLRLAEALFDLGQWRDAATLFDEYLARFPTDAELVRLMAAEVMLLRQLRPTAALKQLLAIDRDRLPKQSLSKYDEMRRDAEKLIDEGVVELEGRAWE